MAPGVGNSGGFGRWPGSGRVVETDWAENLPVKESGQN